MKKGSGTRSGLLWEVERILSELPVQDLPQVLLMENVPQVVSDANLPDFREWERFLEGKGYHNYLQILNAKDYGVAQNRERAFMFSFLDDVYYEFPDTIKLEKRMKDYLEDEVDEKYYLKSEKARRLIESLISNGTLERATSDKRQATSDKRLWTVDGSVNNTKVKSVANCIKARYDAGISNLQSDGNCVLELQEN